MTRPPREFMAYDRIIVAQCPPCAGVPPGRIPIGVVRWADPMPALSIIVKATFSFGEDAPSEGGVVHARLAAAQAPLSRSRVEQGRFDEQLTYPSDFIPYKPEADVLLTGHAHATPAPARHGASASSPETTEIAAQIQVGALSRAFRVVAMGAVDRIPLDHRYLRDGMDSSLRTQPVGPCMTDAILDPPEHHPPDFDYSAYSAAPTVQRTGEVSPAAEIRLVGLSARGSPRSIVLPGLFPRAFIDLRDAGAPSEVDLFCDTLHIDTDRETAVLRFRGTTPLPDRAGRTIRRLIASLESAGAPRTSREIFRNLPRGDFFYASSAEDVSPGAPPVPEQGSRLTMARYAALGHAEAPDPSISLEAHAAIAAELVEARAPRAETLRRYGFDEERWLVEERALKAQVGRAAAGGDEAIAVAYGELFIAAQDRLASPGEADRTLADYRELCSRMACRAPGEVLREIKMSLPEWLRLKRRFGALS